MVSIFPDCALWKKKIEKILHTFDDGGDSAPLSRYHHNVFISWNIAPPPRPSNPPSNSHRQALTLADYKPMFDCTVKLRIHVWIVSELRDPRRQPYREETQNANP